MNWYCKHKHTNLDFNRSFVQSLNASTTNHHIVKYSLPRRYISAQTNLAKNKNITITSADKDGGIVILDTIDYNNKLMNLLNDKNTYIPSSLNTINKNIEIFNKSYRK